MVDALTVPPSSIPDDVCALLTLDQLPGVGPVTVRRLVDEFGTGERALRSPLKQFSVLAGSAAAAARGDPNIRRTVDRALAVAARLGIHVRSWGCPDSPSRLRQLADPPPVLFLSGRLELLTLPNTVTIVGARRATSRGRDVAHRLGVALARAHVPVASGLALGIDGAVHDGVLGAGGDAIAVLGTGPDVVYPRAHVRLFEQIRQAGLLISEFLPGTMAAPYHFPRRNRILAALSTATVVVEAGRKSGSLITVDHALDVGRDVWVVPGPIDSATCAGSNRLLLDGAYPLVDIGEFVATLTGRPVEMDTMTARPENSAPETRLLTALAEDTLQVDELASRVRMPISATLALLTTMELHGEVERMPGMRFRRAA